MKCSRLAVWALASVLLCGVAPACTTQRTLYEEREPEPALGGAPGDSFLLEPAPLSVVAGRYFHTCAIQQGDVFCWGRGDEGALGGDAAHALVPRQITQTGNFTAVRAGQAFSCALDTGGALWCWGSNVSGQLGQGHFDPVTELVSVPFAEAVLGFDLGSAFACALTSSGAVHCWGENQEHQLGRGENSPVGTDQAVPTVVSGLPRTARLSTGEAHVCALGTRGELSCWGRNSENELGLGDGSPVQQKTPARVDSERAYRSVSAGQFSTCAIDAESRLFCWGSNAYGQSHLPGDSSSVPVQVSDRTDLVEVQSNAFHTCYSTQDQEVFCFGLNEWGELGLSDQLPRTEPTRVGGSAATVRFVVAWQHTCLLATDGSLVCSGRSLEGQVGDGSTDIVTEFRSVLFP